MNQILIGIILVLGIGGYFIYQENVTLKANNLALEGAVEEQKQAFEIMKADFELQGQALQNQCGRSLCHRRCDRRRHARPQGGGRRRRAGGNFGRTSGPYRL